MVETIIRTTMLWMFLYFMMAFIAWDYNPGHWSWVIRLVGALVYLAAMFATDEIKKSKK